MRPGVTIALRAVDRSRLEAIVGKRNAPQKHAWRAEITLLSAGGLATVEIRHRTGKSKTYVWRWQERFAEEGVDGLLRDKTRSSRVAGGHRGARLSRPHRGEAVPAAGGPVWRTRSHLAYRVAPGARHRRAVVRPARVAARALSACRLRHRQRHLPAGNGRCQHRARDPQGAAPCLIPFRHEQAASVQPRPDPG